MDPFNWAAVAFILATAGLCAFMLGVPRLLGGSAQGRAKEEIYEAGIIAAGTARLRLSASFYMVAIFFIIFDLEALYLYVYAVSVREVGWVGFWIAVVFIVILLIGLIYELSLGTLDWAPEHHYPSRAPADDNKVDLAAASRYTNFADLASDRMGKIPAQSSGRAYRKEDLHE